MQEQRTTRKQQALQTKESIYDAAVKLFEEHGFENVSVDEITKAAHCATGTFYIYYKSKKDLMYETVHKFNLISDEAYERAKEFPEFRDKLLAYIRYYYEGNCALGRQILRALVGNNVLDGVVDQVNSKNRSIYRVLEQIISEGIQQGCLSDKYEIEYYGRAIVTAVLGVDYYWCTREEVDPVELICDEVGLIVDSLMRLS